MEILIASNSNVPLNVAIGNSPHLIKCFDIKVNECILIGRGMTLTAGR
jgi:hypothetical protein